MTDNADCKCGCAMPADVAERVALASLALATIRNALPGLVVTSWYRCPSRNKKVGGAPKSLHLTGLALDLNVPGMTGAQIAERLEQLIAEGAIPEGGVGRYARAPKLCHYDARSLLGLRRARWRYATT